MGIGALRRAVFLDRDGVLNHLVARRGGGLFSPPTAAEFRLVDGVGAMVEGFKAAGYVVLVATNQPDIARGLMAPAELEDMHRRLMAAAAVDEILVCPHDDADGCSCRKPKPGLITQAAARLGLDLGKSYMVGDSAKDMGAAAAAGVAGILLDRPYNQEVSCHRRVDSLESASAFILAQGR